MQIIHEKEILRAAIRNARQSGRSIGFVPTMGYLHEGHLSLIRRAKQENDLAVVSIFVNPTQFGPNEDLDAYPRDTPRDIELMRSVGTDMAFFPTPAIMYPPGYATFVQVEGDMTQKLCGRTRPTHFRGVTTVVAKLFHLVEPDRAYFGQKDAQQVAVLKKMVVDLDFNLELVVCPIFREPDGLAMSSRNVYLSPGERSQARVLSQALFEARDLILAGERQADTIIGRMRARIASAPSAVIDYIEVVDPRTLTAKESLSGGILIAVAVKIGRTRLIDNLVLEI